MEPTVISYKNEAVDIVFDEWFLQTHDNQGDADCATACLACTCQKICSTGCWV